MCANFLGVLARKFCESFFGGGGLCACTCTKVFGTQILRVCVRTFWACLQENFAKVHESFVKKNVVSFWNTNFAGVCVCQFFGRACTKVLRK